MPAPTMAVRRIVGFDWVGPMFLGDIYGVLLMGSFIVSAVAAVDAFRYHPLEWSAAGYGQRFRFMVIGSPALALVCVPVGAVVASFYLLKMRQSLTLVRRANDLRGAPVPPLAIGLGGVWRELSWRQKTKA
ncbi:hypothetical protein, partial [Asanoa ferruginea]|uniref:hypothetical protein n=1 Tax=Asanoa ferruginea TaxID=53367 RepID=UPI00194367D5